jgi:hypothetical protein
MTRFDTKNETEPIFAQLRARCDSLASHPLFAAAAAGEVPIDVLHEFAFHQYLDSILWVPMLALMKAKATRSRRLAEAIADNIACETGLSGAAHVALATSLLRSLGLASVEGVGAGFLAESASEWLSDEFTRRTEPGVAGWLLGAEALVPVMFAAMEPCFARIAACDTRYFVEHVAVDHDEHAVWMTEAVVDVLRVYGPGAQVEIAHGLDAAYAEATEVPDALYARLRDRAGVSSRSSPARPT